MGRRGANQAAVFFAALGTAFCGFSKNMEMLIVARFVSEVCYHHTTTSHRQLSLVGSVVVEYSRLLREYLRYE